MSKPTSKNILYVIPSLSFGGAEHETIDQVNYLNEIGFNVFFVVLSDKVELYEKVKLSKNNFKVFGVNNFTTTKAKNYLKLPKALKKIDEVIKQNKIDTVITVLPLSHLVLRLHKLFCSANYNIWCFHKSMQYEATPIDSVAKKIIHNFNKKLSEKYDYGHIFISEAVKKNISSFLKIKNGHVIHNAIHLKKETTELAESYLIQNSIKRSDYFVVVPGRLHSTKGHVFFLQSIKKYLLSVSAEKLKILFVGGGPLKQEIESFIETNKLADFVFITDFVDNNLMLSFLKLANLVTIPSIHEGFGNVAIEALMQGATILASNTGGLPEIIKDGENGYLFKAENKEELLEKFILLHKKHKKLDSEMLRKDFRRRFTIQAQMSKIIKVIS